MKINDIQFLNVIWIISSFFFLYYGLSGDGKDLYNSFFFIIIFFLVFWYYGIKEKQKEFDKNINMMGEAVKDQWGKVKKVEDDK